MTVKQGYKLTEVGVIPEDWEVYPFIEVVEKYLDYRGRTPKKLGLDWGGGDILALSANNVEMGQINPEKEAYQASEELYKKWMQNGHCEQGDILMTMEAPLGNIAQIPDDKKYILSQRVLLIRPKKIISKNFLAHYLKGGFFQNQLKANATGSTAQGIQRQKLDTILIYYSPTLPEQTAIANALSDADAYINSLEQLITKKQQIKQGTMQELLTGKKRLDGFSGEWEEKKLGDVADITMGQSPNSNSYNNKGIGLPLIQGNADIKNRKTIRRIYTTDITKKAKSGSIIMSVRAPVGEIAYSLFDVCLGRGVCSISSKSNNIFLLHLLIFLEKKWGNLSKGSTFDSVNSEDIMKFAVAMPQSIEEQTAIANILTHMDNDIQALQNKLTKAKHIKQGMMQELLTGKTRLVQPH